MKESVVFMQNSDEPRKFLNGTVVGIREARERHEQIQFELRNLKHAAIQVNGELDQFKRYTKAEIEVIIMNLARQDRRQDSLTTTAIILCVLNMILGVFLVFS